MLTIEVISPMIRNVDVTHNRAATSVVPGPTPSNQTIQQDAARADEQQQHDDTTVRPPTTGHEAQQTTGRRGGDRKQQTNATTDTSGDTDDVSIERREEWNRYRYDRSASILCGRSWWAIFAYRYRGGTHEVSWRATGSMKIVVAHTRVRGEAETINESGSDSVTQHTREKVWSAVQEGARRDTNSQAGARRRDDNPRSDVATGPNHVPRERRPSNEADTRRCPAQLRRVTEPTSPDRGTAQRQVDERHRRATSEASSTTSQRSGRNMDQAPRQQVPEAGRYTYVPPDRFTGAPGYMRPWIDQPGEPQYEARRRDQQRNIATGARAGNTHGGQRNGEEQLACDPRYMSEACMHDARAANPPQQSYRGCNARILQRGSDDTREGHDIRRNIDSMFTNWDIKVAVRKLSRKFDQMLQTARPKTNIYMFNEPPPPRRRRRSSSSDRE